MDEHPVLEVFAPLLGAAIFAGMMGYGLLTGKMPGKYGGDADRRELPVAFWAVGGIYVVGCVGCIIWFVFALLRR